MNTTRTHPSWCGESHVCSIEAPAGEHRSHPLTVDTGSGRIVATRILTRTGRNRLEIRAVLDLPAEPVAAQWTARALLVRLHQVLRFRAGAR